MNGFISKMHFLYVLVLLQLCNAAIAENIFKMMYRQLTHDYVVETTNGKVDGLFGETEKKVQYISYRGIPYAQPPLNDLRFRPPEPAKNWSGVFKAYEDGNKCTQGFEPIVGEEDCLFINVYTTNLKRDGKLRPVLVWIYGGGFIAGDSSYESFGPDYFLNEDLVFVSFNYRLGIFGFLSTEDLASPGNYGLKDQILALKWVKNNIKNFGGDPDAVTIFGQSAGSASVAYLVQTPLTAGLFHQAITNSGNSLCLWALTRNPREYAVNIARALLILTEDSNAIVSNLRKIPRDKLQRVSFAIQLKGLSLDFLNGLAFSPTLEPQHDGAVLTGKSHQLITDYKYNNVTHLSGFTSEEADGWLETRIFDIPASVLGAPLIVPFDADNSRLVPIAMNVNRTNRRSLGRKIRDYYFAPLAPITLSPGQFETFVSDDQFVRPVREFVRLYSRDAKVYYYRFSYIGKLGLVKGARRYSSQGVSHAEDTHYLFKRNDTAQGDPYDYHVRDQMVRMWSNFVKYGNPTPHESELLANVTWPVTRSNGNETDFVYLDIGRTLKVGKNPHQKAINQWHVWYRKYGNPPYTTY